MAGHVTVCFGGVWFGRVWGLRFGRIRQGSVRLGMDFEVMQGRVR